MFGHGREASQSRRSKTTNCRKTSQRKVRPQRAHGQSWREFREENPAIKERRRVAQLARAIVHNQAMAAGLAPPEAEPAGEGGQGCPACQGWNNFSLRCEATPRLCGVCCRARGACNFCAR